MFALDDQNFPVVNSRATMESKELSRKPSRKRMAEPPQEVKEKEDGRAPHEDQQEDDRALKEDQQEDDRAIQEAERKEDDRVLQEDQQKEEDRALQ